MLSAIGREVARDSSGASIARLSLNSTSRPLRIAATPIRARVRPAHRDSLRTEPRAEQWLLVEWPQGEAEPTRYGLSTRGPTIAIEGLVHEAKLRWRIEREDPEMKDALGLDHVEGRGWRTVHHHAT